MDLTQTCKAIGAESLGYISVEGLKQACQKCNLSFCTGCFTGEYPVAIGNHSKYQFENITQRKECVAL
jgi:amidophosphoribosyltransferase